MTKHLQAANVSRSPLDLERDLLARLLLLHAEDQCTLQVRIWGKRAILDGFVPDLVTKSRFEATFRKLAPGLELLNRLRVGLSEDSAAS